MCKIWFESIQPTNTLQKLVVYDIAQESQLSQRDRATLCVKSLKVIIPLKRFKTVTMLLQPISTKWCSVISDNFDSSSGSIIYNTSPFKYDFCSDECWNCKHAWKIPAQLYSSWLSFPLDDTSVHLILSVVSPSSKRSFCPWTLQLLGIVRDAFTKFLLVSAAGVNLVFFSEASTAHLTAVTQKHHQHWHFYSRPTISVSSCSPGGGTRSEVCRHR